MNVDILHRGEKVVIAKLHGFKWGPRDFGEGTPRKRITVECNETDFKEINAGHVKIVDGHRIELLPENEWPEKAAEREDRLQDAIEAAVAGDRFALDANGDLELMEGPI